MKQTASLNGFEILLYFCVWTGGVFYGIYNVYLQTSKHFKHYNDIYGDFSPGWKWIGNKRDNADSEWKLWIPLIYQIFPWIFAHVLVGQVVKCYFNRLLLCWWYVAITITLLLSFAGLPAIALLLIQPFLSCLITLAKSKALLWTLHLFCLVVMNVIKGPDCMVRQWLGLGEDKYTILMIVWAWIQLKTICFSLETVDKYEREKFNRANEFFKEFTLILAYCLYLPTFFLGQLILYTEFVNGIEKPFEKWTLKRVAIVVLNLARYFFWIFFTELALHFVYFNILHFHPELLRGFDSWALYGFGYCMGQFFANKYVVVYGISSAVAKAENIADLQTPKCIGRIHLYSDMWKYFDRGLYKFLVRYIYSPVSGRTSSSRKVFASLLCFLFIYAWHGIHIFVFIWSVLNFVGVTIETLARWIGSLKIYAETERRLMGPRNARRFHCVLASPLLAMSAISNFYFFGGQEIGNLFMQRIFSDSWKSIFILFSVLYCCCQVSTELKIWDIEKSRRIKVD